jgi:hypothetical protein
MKGHLRERSPGHWAIILDLPDDTGQRKRKWHSFRGTKRQAQDECAKLIAALKAGSYVELSKENVAAYLERWLADVKSRVSPRTHERYAQLLRKNIVPTLGAKRIKDLKAEHVSAVYAAALANGRVDGTGGLSRRSVRHAHVVLKGALKQAVQWGLIAKNPCDDVKPPKPAPSKMQKPNTFTHAWDQLIGTTRLPVFGSMISGTPTQPTCLRREFIPRSPASGSAIAGSGSRWIPTRTCCRICRPMLRRLLTAPYGLS